MIQSEQVRVSEILEPERFRAVGAKIAGLPDASEFCSTVEDDLWRAVIGESESDLEAIAYGELPEKSKSVIGYVDGEAGDEIPWWLQSFAWEVTSRGEKLTLGEEDNYSDNLEKFENFDPQATTLHKPELQNGYSDPERQITELLEKLDDLHEALDDRIGIDDQTSALALPSRIFEIKEGIVRTTSEFESWFNDVLQCCPPINAELTTLLMVETGLERESLEGVISETTLEQLTHFGFLEDGSSKGDYYRPLKKILALDGVFDLRVPHADEFDELGGLETLLYSTWAENYEGDSEKAGEWIERAHEWYPDRLDEGETPLFGSIAFETPLRLQYGMPGYVSLHINSPYSDNNGYSRGGDRKKLREINEIMSDAGFLE